MSIVCALDHARRGCLVLGGAKSSVLVSIAPMLRMVAVRPVRTTNHISCCIRHNGHRIGLNVISD